MAFPALPTDAFAALVDALIPGDDLFPSASSVGVQHWLLDKAREFLGENAAPMLLEALTLDDTPIHELPREHHAAVVARMEQQYPTIFDVVLRITYLGYYSSPLVIRVVRALGHEYNDTPLPKGYTLPDFNPEMYSQTSSAAPRGFYKKTNEITRVDLTGIEI
jgi:hypothetical protein